MALAEAANWKEPPPPHVWPPFRKGSGGREGPPQVRGAVCIPGTFIPKGPWARRWTQKRPLKAVFDGMMNIIDVWTFVNGRLRLVLWSTLRGSIRTEKCWMNTVHLPLSISWTLKAWPCYSIYHIRRLPCVLLPKKSSESVSSKEKGKDDLCTSVGFDK